MKSPVPVSSLPLAPFCLQMQDLGNRCIWAGSFSRVSPPPFYSSEWPRGLQKQIKKQEELLLPNNTVLEAPDCSSLHDERRLKVLHSVSFLPFTTEENWPSLFKELNVHFTLSLLTYTFLSFFLSFFLSLLLFIIFPSFFLVSFIFWSFFCLCVFVFLCPFLFPPCHWLTALHILTIWDFSSSVPHYDTGALLDLICSSRKRYFDVSVWRQWQDGAVACSRFGRVGSSLWTGTTGTKFFRGLPRCIDTSAAFPVSRVCTVHQDGCEQVCPNQVNVFSWRP